MITRADTHRPQPTVTVTLPDEDISLLSHFSKRAGKTKEEFAALLLSNDLENLMAPGEFDDFMRFLNEKHQLQHDR